MVKKMCLPLLVLLIVVFDQSVKLLVVQNMKVGDSISIIRDVFHITYILNPGAAFGMLEHQTVFFIVVACGLILASIYYYRQISRMKFIMQVGIGLLLGGAMGNLIDRIRTGYVVDYFDFRIWPIFNIADCSIVVGVIAIMVLLLFEPQKTGAHYGK